MKKMGLMLLALLLALTPVAALGTAPEAEPALIEDADYRAQIARDARTLLEIVAAVQLGGSGFTGAPDAATAWCALSLSVKRFAADAQVFSEAELGGLYADLFAHGTFDEIAEEPEGLFTKVDGGYQFQMADGDPAYTVIINDTDIYSETEIHAGISAYYDMHGDYPETFSGNATAILTPSPLTEFGAQLSGWIPASRPVFDMAEATSTLNPQEGNTYVAENAIDGKLDTCWAYPATDGAPQSIMISAAEPQVVHGLVMTPGYAKSAYAFESNRRVAAIMVTLSDGSAFAFDLDDVEKGAFDGTYVLPLYGAYETDWVRVEVTQTHPGTRFDDLCVSEIEFF